MHGSHGQTQKLLNSSIWLETLSAAETADLASIGNQPFLTKPDLLVVGAGIVGLAIAHFAAAKGLKVQVIDSRGIAAAASSANFGGIWPNDQGPKHPPEFQPLAFDSRDLWGRLSLRLGTDFDWRVNGMLSIKPGRFPSTQSAIDEAAACMELGFSVAAVDREQILALQPGMQHSAVAGVHFPSEAQLNPLKAALGFARSVVRSGGRVTAPVQATGIAYSDGKISAVQTNRGEIHPAKIVAATAAESDWLASLNVTIPVEARSGQIVATRPLPARLKTTVVAEHLVCQIKSGHILVGGNVVAGVQSEPQADVTAAMIATAVELLPGLTDADFTHAWCGVRPATSDGLPVIDRLPGVNNGWIATGHFRNGVLLAPATGAGLADWIITGTPPETFVPCRLSRFGNAQA